MVVLSDPYQHLYGKVEGLDPDNVWAVVQLAVGSHIMTMSSYCLQPVSQQEFHKNFLRPVQLSRTCFGQHNGIACYRRPSRIKTCMTLEGLRQKVEIPRGPTGWACSQERESSQQESAVAAQGPARALRGQVAKVRPLLQH